MTGRSECAHAVGVDRRNDGRHGNGQADVVPIEHRQQRVQRAMQAVVRLGRTQIGRLDAAAATGGRKVERDMDGEPRPVRPLDLGIGQAALVADRVTILPGHDEDLLKRLASSPR